MSARRLSVCAAFALVCVSIASSGWGAYVRDFTKPNDFNCGSLQRVICSTDLGGLALPEVTACVPFLWVPSPSHNVVSKIDARTGQELARYRMGKPEDQWQPCGMATDFAGNAWVACTNPGRMGRLIRIRASSEAGFTGPEVTQTSKDIDKDGRISGTEVLDWGTDGCVGPVVELGMGSAPSCVVLDDAGRLWVALAGESALVQIDVVSAKAVGRIALPCKPSMMASDGASSIWVVSQEDRSMCRVNTSTRRVTGSCTLGECYPSGICIDYYGKIWISDEYGGLTGYQTKSGVWSKHLAEDGAGYAGIAVDHNGDIWASCPQKREIAHVSGQDGRIIVTLPASDSVGPVSVDGDGLVWVLSRDSNSAVRIDPRENKFMAAALTCSQPSSSTPFTGAIMGKGICGEGWWKVVLDSGVAGSEWQRIDWEASSNGGNVRLDVRTAESPDALESVPLQRLDREKVLPILPGRYLEIRTVLLSNYRTSPVLTELHVEAADPQTDDPSSSDTTAKAPTQSDPSSTEKQAEETPVRVAEAGRG